MSEVYRIEDARKKKREFQNVQTSFVVDPDSDQSTKDIMQKAYPNNPFD